MRDFNTGSFMREFGGALVLSVMAVLAVVAVLSVFTSPDPILMADNADNSVITSAPVTEDTPGPVLNDSGVPGREIARTSPLTDRER